MQATRPGQKRRSCSVSPRNGPHASDDLVGKAGHGGPAQLSGMVLTFAWTTLVRRSATANPRLPEREDVSLRPRLAEGNLERPLENLALLADELIAAAAAEDSVAVGVGVRAVRRPGGLAVHEHPEGDRLPPPRGPPPVRGAGLGAGRG